MGIQTNDGESPSLALEFLGHFHKYTEQRDRHVLECRDVYHPIIFRG